MDLASIEAVLRAGDAKYALLDESGKTLHVAADDESFLAYEHTRAAAACAVGGTATSFPLLLFRRREPPLPLIRAAVGRGWKVGPHRGWPPPPPFP